MGNVDVESLMPEVETTETPPELPEAELNTSAPADKEPQARGEDGKFAGKKPEAKPKEEKPEAKVEKPEHSVPVRTLVEERRQWQAEKKALEERLAKLETPPKPPEAPPEDPKAYADFKVKAALEQLEGTKKEVEQIRQTTQQSQAQTEEIQFGQHLQVAEAAFVKENPDYYEALSHVRQIRAQQLKLLAPEATDQQIAQQIGREEMGLAMQLARSNRNPIATVYELAKAYGYQRKSQEKVELPDVPGQRQLPPDQTLGTGVTTESDAKDDDGDPFDEAFAAIYRPRKAS